MNTALASLYLAAVAIAVGASLLAVAGMLLERREQPWEKKVPWRQTDAWRLLTNIPFVIGTLGIVVIAFIALFGPQLAPADPQAQRVIIFYPDADFAAPPTPPDQYNLLGTDPLGRDQLSRLLWGARLTLTIVLLGLLGRGFLASTLGVIAGWRRGSWVDQAIGHVTNAIGGLPQLMLALLLVIAFQSLELGITGFVIALALVGWAEMAQFVRAEVIRVVATSHVEAARALGAKASQVVRTHVLRDLTPQLLGLLALEAGSVLLLLAELGFIGFFVAGGVFYVSDSGAPILPVRDRAPEWGQMLAGARNYAFDHQYVAFVPGVVVVSAVLAFNLFAEGLRMASDPFHASRLSPRTLGAMARTLVAGGLIAAVAFGYVSTTSTHISYDDGLRRARDAAERVLPGSAYLAGVVRFQSSAHALSRPSKLTYYFQGERERVVRVSFIDADANAMDVKLDSNEDGLLISGLTPITQAEVVAWELALTSAEEVQGIRYRNANPGWTLRVLLAQDRGAEGPSYRVQYGKIGAAAPEFDIQLDAVSGSTAVTAERLPEAAVTRGRVPLGGPAKIVQIGATWLSSRPDRERAYGTERPALYSFQLVRSDISHPLTVQVTFEAGFEGLARVTQIGSFGGQLDTRTIPEPPFGIDDLERAFAQAENAGMRALREGWVAEGLSVWSVSAGSLRVGERGPVSVGPLGVGSGERPGRWMIDVSLMAQRPSGGFNSSQRATFRYDPETDQATRLTTGTR